MGKGWGCPPRARQTLALGRGEESSTQRKFVLHFLCLFPSLSPYLLEKSNGRLRICFFCVCVYPKEKPQLFSPQRSRAAPTQSCCSEPQCMAALSGTDLPMAVATLGD